MSLSPLFYLPSTIFWDSWSEPKWRPLQEIPRGWFGIMCIYLYIIITWSFIFLSHILHLIHFSYILFSLHLYRYILAYVSPIEKCIFVVNHQLRWLLAWCHSARSLDEIARCSMYGMFTISVRMFTISYRWKECQDSRRNVQVNICLHGASRILLSLGKNRSTKECLFAVRSIVWFKGDYAFVQI